MSDPREVVYRWAGPPAIEVSRTPVTLSTGLSYVSHSVITADGRRGVVIVATRGDEVLFVRSERPAVGATLWELPRGFGEASIDDPDGSVHDGIRELQDESGYRVSDAVDRGGFFIDTSILPTEVRVIECIVAADAVAGQTDGEVSGVRWVPRAHVRGWVQTGEVRDAITLSALAIAEIL